MIGFRAQTELSQRVQQERELVTIPWYTTIRFEWAFTDVKDETTLFFHSKLLILSQANNWHDPQLTQVGNRKTFTKCLLKYWTGVRFCFSLNWQYLNKNLKKKKNRKLLLEAKCFTSKYSYTKNERADSLDCMPLKIGNLGKNSQLWYWQYTHGSQKRAAYKIKWKYN